MHSRHCTHLRLSALVLALLAMGPATGVAYVGSLSSVDYGILGGGSWITPGPTILGWSVVFEPTLWAWRYSYDLSHPGGETSHFILEVSETFTIEDILWAEGEFGNVLVDWFQPDGSNPGMPDPIYGIKFDETYDTDTHLEFLTRRSPVWGDFYAKDGKQAGLWAYAYNAGFSLTDPVGPPQDGSLLNHLLVPDTLTPVPEPSTLLLLGAGLAGGALVWRKRRR